jgi:hypothetical protein
MKSFERPKSFILDTKRTYGYSIFIGIIEDQWRNMVFFSHLTGLLLLTLLHKGVKYPHEKNQFNFTS